MIKLREINVIEQRGKETLGLVPWKRVNSVTIITLRHQDGVRQVEGHVSPTRGELESG